MKKTTKKVSKNNSNNHKKPAKKLASKSQLAATAPEVASTSSRPKIYNFTIASVIRRCGKEGLTYVQVKKALGQLLPESHTLADSHIRTALWSGKHYSDPKHAKDKIANLTSDQVKEIKALGE